MQVLRLSHRPFWLQGSLVITPRKMLPMQQMSIVCQCAACVIKANRHTHTHTHVPLSVVLSTSVLFLRAVPGVPCLSPSLALCVSISFFPQALQTGNLPVSFFSWRPLDSPRTHLPYKGLHTSPKLQHAQWFMCRLAAVGRETSSYWRPVGEELVMRKATF